MEGSKKNPRQVRIDKKHRFQLRIAEVDHCEAESICFRHNLSLNLLYCEAIKFALDNVEFMRKIQYEFVRDVRRGHFIYTQDTDTLRRGEMY